MAYTGANRKTIEEAMELILKFTKKQGFKEQQVNYVELIIEDNFYGHSAVCLNSTKDYNDENYLDCDSRKNNVFSIRLENDEEKKIAEQIIKDFKKNIIPNMNNIRIKDSIDKCHYFPTKKWKYVPTKQYY